MEKTTILFESAIFGFFLILFGIMIWVWIPFSKSFEIRTPLTKFLVGLASIELGLAIILEDRRKLREQT